MMSRMVLRYSSRFSRRSVTVLPRRGDFGPAGLRVDPVHERADLRRRRLLRLLRRHLVTGENVDDFLPLPRGSGVEEVVGQSVRIDVEVALHLVPGVARNAIRLEERGSTVFV